MWQIYSFGKGCRCGISYTDYKSNIIALSPYLGQFGEELWIFQGTTLPINYGLLIAG